MNHTLNGFADELTMEAALRRLIPKAIRRVLEKRRYNIEVLKGLAAGRDTSAKTYGENLYAIKELVRKGMA